MYREIKSRVSATASTFRHHRVCITRTCQRHVHACVFGIGKHFPLAILEGGRERDSLILPPDVDAKKTIQHLLLSSTRDDDAHNRPLARLCGMSEEALAINHNTTTTKAEKMEGGIRETTKTRKEPEFVHSDSCAAPPQVSCCNTVDPVSYWYVPYELFETFFAGLNSHP